jgi:hypothetical protein
MGRLKLVNLVGHRSTWQKRNSRPKKPKLGPKVGMRLGPPGLASLLRDPGEKTDVSRNSLWAERVVALRYSCSKHRVCLFSRHAGPVAGVHSSRCTMR